MVECISIEQIEKELQWLVRNKKLMDKKDIIFRLQKLKKDVCNAIIKESLRKPSSLNIKKLESLSIIITSFSLN